MFTRPLRVRNGRLPARVPLLPGSAGTWQPIADAGIDRCDGFRLGVFPVEDCFVAYEQARYVPGVLTNREGFGVWDLEARGGPVETFPDDDAGWEAARLRAQDLIRADPGTAELLAWIRRERAIRPW